MIALPTCRWTVKCRAARRHWESMWMRTIPETSLCWWTAGIIPPVIISITVIINVAYRIKIIIRSNCDSGGQTNPDVSKGRWCQIHRPGAGPEHRIGWRHTGVISPAIVGIITVINLHPWIVVILISIRGRRDDGGATIIGRTAAKPYRGYGHEYDHHQ